MNTFAEVMKAKEWRNIKRLLQKTNETITVMESPASMGRYSAVVLTGKGFQCESGRAGESAAHAGNTPTFTPIKSGAKKVLETVLRYNEPLDEHDKRPTESEIVADMLKKIEKIRNPEPAK